MIFIKDLKSPNGRDYLDKLNGNWYFDMDNYVGDIKYDGLTTKNFKNFSFSTRSAIGPAYNSAEPDQLFITNTRKPRIIPSSNEAIGKTNFTISFLASSQKTYNNEEPRGVNFRLHASMLMIDNSTALSGHDDTEVYFQISNSSIILSRMDNSAGDYFLVKITKKPDTNLSFNNDVVNIVWANADSVIDFYAATTIYFRFTVIDDIMLYGEILHLIK